MTRQQHLFGRDADPSADGAVRDARGVVAYALRLRADVKALRARAEHYQAAYGGPASGIRWHLDTWAAFDAIRAQAHALISRAYWLRREIERRLTEGEEVPREG